MVFCRAVSSCVASSMFLLPLFLHIVSRKKLKWLYPVKEFPSICLVLQGCSILLNTLARCIIMIEDSGLFTIKFGKDDT